jgi:2-oxoglutarate ferredoxin oxidoreductase subunit delta
MSLIEIDPELCKSCGFCIDACAENCLALGKAINSKGYRVVEFVKEEGCDSCKRCAVMCPEAAITVYLREAA